MNPVKGALQGDGPEAWKRAESPRALLVEGESPAQIGTAAQSGRSLRKWARDSFRSAIARFWNSEENREAMIVSALIGLSLFVAVSLIGTYMLLRKDIKQIQSNLDETSLESLTKNLSTKTDTPDIVARTEKERVYLDHEIELCLRSLRHSKTSKAHGLVQGSEGDSVEMTDLREALKEQQEKINLYLELIALQNKKLSTYHRENQEIRELLLRSKNAAEGESAFRNERDRFESPIRPGGSRILIKPA